MLLHFAAWSFWIEGSRERDLIRAFGAAVEIRPTPFSKPQQFLAKSRNARSSRVAPRNADREIKARKNRPRPSPLLQLRKECIDTTGRCWQIDCKCAFSQTVGRSALPLPRRNAPIAVDDKIRRHRKCHVRRKPGPRQEVRRRRAAEAEMRQIAGAFLNTTHYDVYREVFAEETRCRHREHLFRRIAWRVQALAEGDLTERARERASQLACEIRKAFGL